jgi:hypothetical protein
VFNNSDYQSKHPPPPNPIFFFVVSLSFAWYTPSPDPRYLEMSYLRYCIHRVVNSCMIFLSCIPEMLPLGPILQNLHPSPLWVVLWRTAVRRVWKGSGSRGVTHPLLKSSASWLLSKRVTALDTERIFMRAGRRYRIVKEICFYGIKWLFLYWDYVASFFFFFKISQCIFNM